MEPQEPDPLHHPYSHSCPGFIGSSSLSLQPLSPMQGQFTASCGCYPLEQAQSGPVRAGGETSSTLTSLVPCVFLLLHTCTPSAALPLALSLDFIQPLPTSHPPTLTSLDFPVATCSCSTLRPQGPETQRDLPTHTFTNRQTR